MLRRKKNEKQQKYISAQLALQLETLRELIVLIVAFFFGHVHKSKAGPKYSQQIW